MWLGPGRQSFGPEHSQNCRESETCDSSRRRQEQEHDCKEFVENPRKK